MVLSMPETFGGVVDYISSQLSGFVTDQPMYATTETAMSPTALTVKLSLPAQSQPQGVIEIDDELMFVQSFNAETGIATIPKWGRGQQGTTATSHATDAKVTVNPRFPRGRIAQVANQVIAGMCPPLFAVQRGSFTTVPQQWEYPLPASTRNLISCEYRLFGSDAYDWMPLRGAHIKRDSGSPTLHVGDAVGCAQVEVRYTVACNPAPLTTYTQAFTASGLPESCIDIVSLGSIPRLITTAELARQQITSVEASERALLMPSGSGAAAARLYMQMYEARLSAEVKRQRQEYPLRLMRNI